MRVITRIPNCARAYISLARRQGPISPQFTKCPTRRQPHLSANYSTAESSYTQSSTSKPFIPVTDRANPAVWFELFEKALPSNFGEAVNDDAPNTFNLSPPLPASDLAEVVYQARWLAGIDILTYCGVQMNRWDDMHNAFIALIHLAKTRTQSSSIEDILSTIQWPDHVALNDITSKVYKPANVSMVRAEFPKSERGKALTTLSGHSGSTDKSLNDLIGNVWISLGSLIIEAGNNPRFGSEGPLVNALRILRCLRDQGFIPKAIHSASSNQDSSAMMQPEVLGQYFGQMYHSLSNVPSDVGPPSKHPETFPSVSHVISSPSMWLEFVLWCCVHARLVMEGATIVQELLKPGKNTLWRLVDWQGSVNLLENENVISARVVAALIDGLVSLPVATSGESDHHLMPTILNKISALKKVLVRHNMGLGSITWDAILSRFLDNPSLTSAEANPVLLEEALQLAEGFGGSVNSQPQLGPKEVDSTSNAATYIFDASAAVIGFYHRVLETFVRSRDITGALRVLKRLQSFTDANKKKSLEQFFTRLKSSRGLMAELHHKGNSKEIEKAFPEIQYPSYFLDIPTGVLAELLDLVVASEDLEFGKWMIYSDDIDGPLIPPSLYGDQTIAPSLLRFAATTSDGQLLLAVMKVQTVDVSGDTLLALCATRIEHGDISGAIEVLELLRKHSQQDLSVDGISKLLKGLLGQIYGHPASKDLNSSSSKRASRLLQKILRGDSGQAMTISLAEIDSLVAVVSSLDRHLNKICSNVRALTQQYKIELPTFSFNRILEAATKIWGSRKGMAVFDYWCIDSSERYVANRASLGQPGSPSRKAGRVSKLFSSPVEEEANESTQPGSKQLQVHGKINPDISTIRIVIQKALEEKNLLLDLAQDQQQSLSKDVVLEDEVLEWAANTLTGLFGLPVSEVDYELHGYLSHSRRNARLSDTPYNGETLRIWEAFIGTRKPWALSVEERLRAFVANKNEKQILFEPEPAAERALLHSLAGDYGLASESPPGNEPMRQLRVYKKSNTLAVLPTMRVDEARVHHVKVARGNSTRVS